MRRRVTLLMVFVGFLFQFLAYLFMTSPIGPVTGPEVSNPRLEFSPVIFIFGVMLVFVAAIVYEVMPEMSDDYDLDHSRDLDHSHDHVHGHTH